MPALLDWVHNADGYGGNKTGRGAFQQELIDEARYRSLSNQKEQHEIFSQKNYIRNLRSQVKCYNCHPTEAERKLKEIETFQIYRNSRIPVSWVELLAREPERIDPLTGKPEWVAPLTDAEELELKNLTAKRKVRRENEKIIKRLSGDNVDAYTKKRLQSEGMTLRKDSKISQTEFRKLLKLIIGIVSMERLTEVGYEHLFEISANKARDNWISNNIGNAFSLSKEWISEINVVVYVYRNMSDRSRREYIRVLEHEYKKQLKEFRRILTIPGPAFSAATPWQIKWQKRKDEEQKLMRGHAYESLPGLYYSWNIEDYGFAKAFSMPGGGFDIMMMSMSGAGPVNGAYTDRLMERHRLSTIQARRAAPRILGVNARTHALWQKQAALWRNRTRFTRLAKNVRYRLARATKGLGGRVLSAIESAEFATFAKRARTFGLTENPYRTGSWGKVINGRYQEVARIDVAEIGKPGWRGKTHLHITGKRGHLPLNTPLLGE